jgi:hypothetical protein
MKAFKILTGFGDYQNYLVIADNMAQAERIFEAKYFPTSIKAIELLSNYVQIQDFDEQPKEARDE